MDQTLNLENMFGPLSHSFCLSLQSTQIMKDTSVLRTNTVLSLTRYDVKIYVPEHLTQTI